MKWDTKCGRYEFQYDSSSDSSDNRWDRMEETIKREGLDGWELCSVETKSAFNTDYTLLTTFATVWYKRPKDEGSS